MSRIAVKICGVTEERDAIEAAVTKLAAEARPGDRVFIVLIGHGADGALEAGRSGQPGREGKGGVLVGQVGKPPIGCLSEPPGCLLAQNRRGSFGETHIRSSTRSAIRQAMRESFCPVICAACEVAVFHECRDLKRGNWEILGKGVRPRCPRDLAVGSDREGSAPSASIP